MDDALAAGVRAGERAAVARALNLTEDRRPTARRALSALFAELARDASTERGHRVGVTGPPGVGKSTLVSAMTRAWRRADKTVGVLAIDPSSLRSGGALLGDRLRIAPDPSDPGVFVRSLATAGELGGLARSAAIAVRVLGAAFDVALVETVGVGQTETEVRQVVDTVVFVVQPGSGDALQFLKAGIMEVPDILVVNKADEGAIARRAHAELTSACAALRGAGVAARAAPIVLTSARDGSGVDALVLAIAAHHDDLAAAGMLAPSRRAGAIAWSKRAFVRRHGEVGVERAGGGRALEDAIAKALDAGTDPLEWLARVDSFTE